MTHNLVGLTLVFAMAAVSTPAMAEENRSGGHQRGAPPQEAFDACSSQSEGDSCEVTTPRGDTLEGQCRTPPNLSELVCVPERHAKGMQK